MSTTVRPDNLKAALDAKIAAAMSRLVELREADEPRITPHLNAKESVTTFLQYAGRVQPIAEAFGREQAGDLQFEAWYGEWTERLGEPDRALWKQFRDERVRQDLGLGTELIEVELAVPADPAATAREPGPGASAQVGKRVVRFAAAPNRSASDVCYDFARLARRFAQDFVRDYARFLK
jgi:hypothetical protein